MASAATGRLTALPLENALRERKTETLRQSGLEPGPRRALPAGGGGHHVAAGSHREAAWVSGRASLHYRA